MPHTALCMPHGLDPANCALASCAPSTSASSLAHTAPPGRRFTRFQFCEKPQSVLADHILPPTQRAVCSRCATSRGCSTTLAAWLITPGMRILPSGSLVCCQTSRLVLVPRVGRFDRVGLCLHPQHQVDDVCQRHVPGVRDVLAAPADVVAHPVLLDAEGGVQGLDGQLHSTGSRYRCRQHVGVSRRHPGVVHLEEETGVDDGVVLLLERVCDGEEQNFSSVVVVVGAGGFNATRRCYGQDASDWTRCSAAVKLAMSRLTASLPV